MFREKISKYIKSINESEDNEYLDLIEELIASASEYILRVNALEIAMMVGKYNKEGNEYRESIEKLDRQRSISHNALISNVKIINRLCKKHSISLIYEGDEDKRVEIAEFAQKIVSELFNTRRL